MVEAVGYAAAYSFSYSPRPGTPAAEMDAQVSDALKAERLHRLQALIIRQQNAFNAAFIGQTVEVLLEKPARLTGQLVGRSPYLQAVHVMADADLIGQVVPVVITGMGTNTLNGAIAGERRATVSSPALAEAGA